MTAHKQVGCVVVVFGRVYFFARPSTRGGKVAGSNYVEQFPYRPPSSTFLHPAARYRLATLNFRMFALCSSLSPRSACPAATFSLPSLSPHSLYPSLTTTDKMKILSLSSLHCTAPLHPLRFTSHPSLVLRVIAPERFTLFFFRIQFNSSISILSVSHILFIFSIFVFLIS